MPIIKDLFDANARELISELEAKHARVQSVFATAESPDFRRTINAHMKGIRSAIEAVEKHQAHIHDMIERGVD